jgi:hypothetical protein
VLALLKSDGARRSVDDRRHVGIVVTDRRAVAEVLGLDDLAKSLEAVRELEEAGLAPVDTS